MSQRHRTARHTEHASASPAPLLRACLLGFLCALVAATLLLFVGAALCMLAEDPNSPTRPMAFGVLCLSSAIGGFVAARHYRGAALVCGLVSGGLLIGVFCLIAPLVGSAGEELPFALALALRLLGLLCAVLGALVGARPKTHRRRKAR